MTITWINCAERMPPDDGEPIIFKFYSIISLLVYNAVFDVSTKNLYANNFKHRMQITDRKGCNICLWSI